MHAYIDTYVRQGQADGRTDRRTDGRTDRQTDRQTDRHASVYVYAGYIMCIGRDTHFLSLSLSRALSPTLSLLQGFGFQGLEFWSAGNDDANPGPA